MIFSFFHIWLASVEFRREKSSTYVACGLKFPNVGAVAFLTLGKAVLRNTHDVKGSYRYLLVITVQWSLYNPAPFVPRKSAGLGRVLD